MRNLFRFCRSGPTARTDPGSAGRRRYRPPDAVKGRPGTGYAVCVRPGSRLPDEEPQPAERRNNQVCDCQFVRLLTPTQHGKSYRIGQSERRRGQNHHGHQSGGFAGPAGQEGAAARRRPAGQRHVGPGLRHQPGRHLRVHLGGSQGRRGDPRKPRNRTSVAAALVDRPGGRRRRAAQDGGCTPRHQAHRRLGARPLRLHLHRLLALAGLHDGQNPHGGGHGADSRAVRIPGPGRALQAAGHDPQGQEFAQPRARDRRFRADDVHAQPAQQPGGHRGSRPLRRPDLRHHHPAQHPPGRGPLARQTRGALRRQRHRFGKLPQPGPRVPQTQQEELNRSARRSDRHRQTKKIFAI